MNKYIKRGGDWLRGKDIPVTTEPLTSEPNSPFFSKKRPEYRGFLTLKNSAGDEELYLRLDLGGRPLKYVDIDIDPDPDSLRFGGKDKEYYSSLIHVELKVPKAEEIEKSGVRFLTKGSNLQYVNEYINIRDELGILVACGEDVHLNGFYADGKEGRPDLGGWYLVKLKKYDRGSRLEV